MRKLASDEYHRARAAMEMERALQAADAKTAALHRELARLHLLSVDEDDGQAGTAQPPVSDDRLARAAE